MTSPPFPDEQRVACRAAINATIETLLDLDIPTGIIVEVLASSAVSLPGRMALRQAKANSSNDDQKPPRDRRYMGSGVTS